MAGNDNACTWTEFSQNYPTEYMEGWDMIEMYAAFYEYRGNNSNLSEGEWQ